MLASDIDGDLDRVLLALQHHHDGGSDDEIQQTAIAVQAQCRGQFARRGFLLCQYMRARRQVHGRSKEPLISPHVLALIEQYNSNHAKT